MAQQQYRIVPAPTRPRRRAPGSDAPARFVATLEEEVNRMAADGWTFVRTETMTYERKKGLFRHTEETIALLVFARSLEEPAVAAEPEAEPALRRPRPIGPALRLSRGRAPGEGPKLVGPARPGHDEPEPA